MSGPTTPVRNDCGIISNPAMNYSPDPRGLGCAIFDRMYENRELVAQIDGITGEKDKFASLLKRCIRTAMSLHSRGLTSNDVVTICSYNHLNSCVPYMASLFLGIKVACLDPSLCLPDTVKLLIRVRPKIAFICPEAIALMEEAIGQAQTDTQIVLFGNSPTYTQFSEFLAPHPDECDFIPEIAADLNETAIILFTGGTTGVPKPVCLSHKSLLCQVYELKYHTSRHAPPKTCFKFQVSFSTFYWISSLSIALYSIFYRRTRVVFPKFDEDSFWSLIERANVNVTFLAPSQVQRLCKKGRPPEIDISTLHHVAITGNPISKELILQFKELLPGVKVRNVYAIAEAGGYVMAFRPHVFLDDARLLEEKPDSCGRPRPGMSCKVVDNETGEILGPHQTGELRIKTNFQMNSYYNMDSSSCWDADGWLKSGDIAYYDEDNCFYVIDRMQDMLRFRSWFVAPARLEALLHSHPAIESAVVVGLPHPEDGEHAVGVVVLRRSAVATVTAREIEDFVEQVVSDKYRLRGGVRIVEKIPFTPLGKARRMDIRKLVAEGAI